MVGDGGYQRNIRETLADDNGSLFHFLTIMSQTRNSRMGKIKENETGKICTSFYTCEKEIERNKIAQRTEKRILAINDIINTHTDIIQ